jgi:tryptophan 2,3-dioxygenase
MYGDRFSDVPRHLSPLAVVSSGRQKKQQSMPKSNEKYATIHYANYLQLDKILGAQSPRSAEVEDTPAHEEMLFIVIHQVYELWFKQIIHEVSSVVNMFQSHNVDERNIGTAVARLKRVIEIQELLIKQIHVLETLTPLDFLDFRNYLFPASGFQSFQFRLVETLLGLREEDRITYNNKRYDSEFNPDQQQQLKDVMEHGSLFDAVEDWLERTPFLDFGDFDFLEQYKIAVVSMLDKEQKAIKNSDYLSAPEKEMRLRMLGTTDTFFESILSEEAHKKMQEEGKLRLSYRATLAALLIRVYRDEPILHTPYNLLNNIVEIDELFTTWRYRHSQMVLRMLGRKIGTGGSSGYEYLHATAVKHHIFWDFHNISTLLIPRSERPVLPDSLKRELGFYFTAAK